MNGEDQLSVNGEDRAPPAPAAPPPHEWGGPALREWGGQNTPLQPLRRLRRHLPINGEDQLSVNGEDRAPPAPAAPPPHEWGGQSVPHEWGGPALREWRGPSHQLKSRPWTWARVSRSLRRAVQTLSCASSPGTIESASLTWAARSGRSTISAKSSVQARGTTSRIA